MLCGTSTRRAWIWIDDYSMTWLASPPKIKLLPVLDAREPYPLSWEEQTRLFRELPAHLARMALFKVNTGCREQEVCQLKWEWECWVPELNTSMFIIPSGWVKNREDRLVVLNSIAKSIIEEVRGQHKEYVFVYQGHKVGKINNLCMEAGTEGGRIRACPGSRPQTHLWAQVAGRRCSARNPEGVARSQE